MKSPLRVHSRYAPRGFVALLTVLAAAACSPAARADVYVTNWAANTVSQYSDSGALINPSLITGLNFPGSLTVVGSDIFVINAGNATVGESR